MKEIILNVEGMMCSGCENRIKNSVNKIDNVKEVKADHVAGTVTVTADESVDVSLIKQRITDLDFIVKE